MMENTTKIQIDQTVIEAVKARLSCEPMISGNGQYHTAKPGAKKPKPYRTITFTDIARMVRNPVQVPKPEAPWVIFSSAAGPLAREASFQLEHGKYHALWADLDHVGSLTVLGMGDALNVVLPGVMAFIYNTHSATPDNQKCRIIIPLAEPCPGADFCIYQKIFNDKLTKAGIDPDHATERTSQLCYLPNRGESYDAIITEGEPLK